MVPLEFEDVFRKSVFNSVDRSLIDYFYSTGYVPCLINPALHEPFGYVFLESISAGIPAMFNISAGISYWSDKLVGLIPFDFHFDSDHLFSKQEVYKLLEDIYLAHDSLSGEAKISCLRTYSDNIVHKLKILSHG